MALQERSPFAHARRLGALPGFRRETLGLPVFAAVAARGLAAFGAERLDEVAVVPEAGSRRDVGDQLVGVGQQLARDVEANRRQVLVL